MNILFFDVETTGLPRDYKAPITDLNNWPHVVQIAFQYYKDDKLEDSLSYIVKPDGFEIPKESSDIHGVTQERALKEGQSLSLVMTAFDARVKRSDILIAHNIDFDYKVVGTEYLRSGVPINDFIMLKRFCTMKSTVEFCNLPGQYGNKWPKLSELHIKLFDEDFSGAHDAGADVDAMVRCYFELKKREII